MLSLARAIVVGGLFLSCLMICSRGVRAEGVLLGHTAEGEDRQLLPLTRTEVHTSILGSVVATQVTQRFANSFDAPLEAVYVFPLPHDAAVDDMQMRIGERVIRADIKPRDAARETYVAASQSGRRAALLEQERPNIFTFSVANIDPGKEIEVQLHFFQSARYEHGTYEMAFPTTVGPRYIPGQPLSFEAHSGTGAHADTTQVMDASRISPEYVPPDKRSGHTIGITVHLDAGSRLETVESVEHRVNIARPTPSTALITLREQDEIPNRDFILRWRLTVAQLQPTVFAYRPRAEDRGYLTLHLEPGHDLPIEQITPREIFFLLDTSGSMSGFPMQTVQSFVHKALGALHPQDTFQIIDFADTASLFSPQPLPNTPENLTRANDYLSHLRAAGGTNQLAGIHAALSAPGDASRIRYVLFLTDGYIGNEHEVLGLVQRVIGNARIFGFGVGRSVNRYLLDEVSHVGRGSAEFIQFGADADAVIQRFYERISKPYLTDITIDWGGFEVSDVQPTPIPDLSALSPLKLYARYRGSGRGTIEVRGRIAMHAFSRRLEVDLPAVEQEGAAISRLWARQKIESLSRFTHWHGETLELSNAIRDLALEHRLMSKFTSFVAVDSAPPVDSSGDRLLIVQPSEGPDGVDLRAAGGRSYTNASAEVEGVGAIRTYESLRSTSLRRRGCATCAVGNSSGGGAASYLIVAALLTLALMRRRIVRLS